MLINKPIKADWYKSYKCEYANSIRKALDEGYDPLTIPEIIRYKVKCIADPKLFKSLWYEDFASGDGVAFGVNNEIKLVREFYKKVDTSKLDISNGAFLLTKKLYTNIGGVEITRENSSTLEDTLKNKSLEDIFRDEHEVYSKLIYKFGKTIKTFFHAPEVGLSIQPIVISEMSSQDYISIKTVSVTDNNINILAGVELTIK